MKTKKIAVLGGGGVGAYVAAKLGQNFDTILLSDSLKNVTLIENNQPYTYNIPIHSTPQEHFDILIVALKSNVLSQRLQKIKESITPKTTIVPLLNGIAPYEQIKRDFPQNPVAKAAIYIISNKRDDGLIEVKGKGAMIVLEDINEDTRFLAEALNKSGIKVQIPSNIDKAIWQKYLFIAATAALTTKYNATFGQITSNHLDEFTALLDEIIHIANKKGVVLTSEEKEKAIKLLQKSPPNAKTSLQLDFEQKRIGELDNIVGYLAKESKTFEKIYHQLKNGLS